MTFFGVKKISVLIVLALAISLAQPFTQALAGLNEDKSRISKSANNSPESIEASAFVEQGKLLANDGAAQDNFGFSVAVSGDYAIVGSPRDQVGAVASQGSAYIYVRNNGVWTQQQKLVGSDSATTDQFGYSVAISGNTAVVGRHNTTTGQNRSDGKVYVFTRTGTTWTETQTLVSNDIAQGDSFGYAVALENDTLIVGARNKNNGASVFFQGAAYVFTRPSGGSFTQQAKLLASDGGFADFFGEAVSVSGDTAVIGTVNDFGQANAIGKAYVFTRNGSTWTEQQILQAGMGGAPNGSFGTSVSVSGDYTLIGARTEAIGSSGELGAAYVFVRSGSVWTQQQKLTAQETTPRNDQFGYAVAIKGDMLAIGSPAHEYIPSIANHGAVYVYKRSGSVWGRTDKLVHGDPSADALGQAVAFDGNSIIAGAPAKNSNRGAAYVFNLVENAQPKLLGEAFVNPGYGQSVAISGDIAAVGSNIGVYIFNRSGDDTWGFTQKIPATVDGTTTIAPGTDVDISGDTMVIGAGGSRINGAFGQGAVLVYVRSGAMWTLQQQITAADGAAGDAFGRRVAISGETIVIGADGDANGANNGQGSAYIYTRSGTTWSLQQKLLANDGAANDRFGTNVGISGDSVIVGASADTIGSNNGQGSAYVFTRSGTTWTQQQKLTSSDGGSNDQFGTGVTIENDTAVVGATGANNINGTAYVFTRTRTTWTEQQKLNGDSGELLFGYATVLSGNTLLVGSYNANNTVRGINTTGAVYVFSKNGSSWTRTGKLHAFDGASGDQLGTSIAISNNTVISGAPGDDVNGMTDQGSAYILNLNGSQNTAPPFFDFDGDGKTDLSIFRPSNGEWWYQQSSDNVVKALTFGISTDKITPSDFDGDGKTDIAFFRPSTGEWFVLRSSNLTFFAAPFGASTDKPAPGDFDGDGKTDFAIFRPSDATWYILKSTGGVLIVPFGASNDIPVVGDYDGDGKSDVAIYRPVGGSGNSEWWILRSSNSSVFATPFGTSSDKPVQADYTGDGKTDCAFFRASSATWYVLRSEDLSFYGAPFGASTDIPSAGDYDGDGKADLAVFRPSGATWFVLKSTGGTLIQSFGATNDIPVPSAFVP